MPSERVEVRVIDAVEKVKDAGFSRAGYVLQRMPEPLRECPMLPDPPHFAVIWMVAAPVRPKTSGEYISSTLVGGSTNAPSDVARAR